MYKNSFILLVLNLPLALFIQMSLTFAWGKTVKNYLLTANSAKIENTFKPVFLTASGLPGTMKAHRQKIELLVFNQHRPTD